jgi:hypothetical protein
MGVAVPWMGKGTRSTRKRWARFRLDTRLSRFQSVARLIGDERVPASALTPAFEARTNAFKARCGDLEHSVVTGIVRVSPSDAIVRACCAL